MKFIANTLILSILIAFTPSVAQINVVDNNVNTNPINTLHGYCDGTNFIYAVYWDSTTVSDVELVDDATSTVLASGNTSPLIVTQATTTADTLQAKLRDQSAPATESGVIAIDRRDCSVFSPFSSRSNAGPNYVVPTDVDSVRVTIVGGGGGGGGKSTGSGVNKRGGSGGGSAQSVIAVTAGDTFTYTIGAGGSRGGRNSGFQNGGAGGASSLNLNGSLIARGTGGAGTTSNGNNVGSGAGGDGSLFGVAIGGSTATGASGQVSGGGAANRFGVTTIASAGNGGNGRTGNRGFGIAGQVGGVAIEPITSVVAPSVTIDQLGADPALDSNTGGIYRVVFSTPIDPLTFTAQDINLTGAANATVDSVTEVAPNDGTTFDVAILGADQTGDAVAIIPAGSVNTTLGVNNTASTSTDNIISFNYDADGDLVADAIDIDDDNDGVLDTVESDKPVNGFTIGASTLAENGDGSGAFTIPVLDGVGQQVGFLTLDYFGFNGDGVGGNGSASYTPQIAVGEISGELSIELVYALPDVNGHPFGYSITSTGLNFQDAVHFLQGTPFDTSDGSAPGRVEGGAFTYKHNLSNDPEVVVNTHPGAHTVAGNLLALGDTVSDNTTVDRVGGRNPTRQFNLSFDLLAGQKYGVEALHDRSRLEGIEKTNFVLGLNLSVMGDFDTDEDGVVDRFDLDSDNDGIADIYEAGNTTVRAYDIDGDGHIDATGEGFVDNGVLANSAAGNGLDDRIENLIGTAGAGVTPIDSEATPDGSVDMIDWDSDDDGIPDAVEARATANHVQYPATIDDAADTDDDGILDIFDTGTGFGSTLAAFKTTLRAPYADPDDAVDTLPDYLDTDSDEDTLSDNAEATDLATAPSAADPDGSITDAASILTLLGNSDSESADVDFRSLNDADRDGNPDKTDNNDTTPVAINDGPVIPGSDLDVLANDDFLDNDDANNVGVTTLAQVPLTGTCTGVPNFNASTGMMSYTRAANENFGGSCTFDYRVCNTEPDPDVCATATVTVTLPDEDDDGDGVTNSNEVDAAAAADECLPNTSGTPTTKDCDGDGLDVTEEVAAGTNTGDPDTDGDGNPDDKDPYPTTPTAVADSGAPATAINILSNDDFLTNADSNNEGTTTITQAAGGTCMGSPAFNASAGTVTYTVAAGENFGGMCTFNYQVCNNESGANICQTAEVTINLLDEDDDGDGVTNSNEVDAAAAADECLPNTSGTPTTKDCDGDGLDVTEEVAAGTNTGDPDTDGDGNPDDKDPFPTTPTAGADAGTPDVAIGILANDDYLTNTDANNEGVTTISTFATGTTCAGSAAYDADAGTMTYTASASENAGGSCNLVYEVCNDESGANICATATVVISLVADNDSDGVPDATDLDDDNDGIPDSIEGDSDRDGDGIKDSFDLDSDNDGIPDINESGLSVVEISTLDADGDGRIDDANVMGGNGLADAVETTPDSGFVDYDNDGTADTPIDSDNDGVVDYLDLDKDNDGIPDLVESGLPLSDRALLDSDNDGQIDISVAVSSDGIANDIQSGTEGAPLDFEFIDSDDDGVLDALDLDSDDDGILDLMESGLSMTDITALDVDGNGQIDPTVVVGSDGIANDIQSGIDGDPLDFMAADTDGDGLADALDLDSDNDGIPDLIESGIPLTISATLDSDGDGQIDAAVQRGSDGVADILQGLSDGGGITYPLVDTDKDGITDNRDLDKDNDGIPDLMESGLSDAEIAALDVDGDGQIDNTVAVGADGIADDVQGGADKDPLDYTQADTDDDGVPDALDLDSDSDGIPDLIESGLSLVDIAALDSDGDGQIDNTVAVSSDGIADDVQGSVEGDPLNYTLANTDGDGVPDYRDLDSDNDGLLDALEAGVTDTNGDGLADGIDNDGDGLIDSPAPTTSSIPDSDGDGKPDYRELDSDDDGTFDNAEPGVEPSVTELDSNGDGIVDDTEDTDGDGIVDSADGSPTTFGSLSPDSDGDGITDNLDLDDDNDGIPDSIEGAADADGDGIPNYLDLDSDNDGIPDLNETGLSIANIRALDQDGDGQIDTSAAFGSNGLADAVETEADANDVDYDRDSIADGPIDSDQDGVPDYLDLDKDNDGIPDLVESGLPKSDIDVLDSDGDGRIDVTVSVGNDGIADEVQGETDGDPLDYTTIDTDSDGVLDALDLDSDNDGIPDLLESGLSLSDIQMIDSDGDGQIDSSVPVGLDGIADEIQSGADEGPLDFTQVDSDSDGLPDAVDLDSDNDGIIDVIEAGLLDENGDGFADGEDTDGDGIVDTNSADAATIPDSDGDGIPDFQEIDSDNNGINDNAEPGVSPIITALDSDGDGRVDDVVDTDNDGIPDAADPSPTVFGYGADSDNDGIPDAIDLDDDNDGVLDTLEGDGDTDGDGIPDTLDLDSDNDGILDVIEGAASGSPVLDSNGDGVIDTVIDANNDGVHDTVDLFASAIDTDNDGKPDHQDVDSDGDGIMDLVESGLSIELDADNDGVLDAVVDANNDGVADGLSLNLPVDTDLDGAPDYRDLDSDGDGFSDEVENTDFDGNGIPDYLEDNEGLITAVDGAGSMGLGILFLLSLLLAWRWKYQQHQLVKITLLISAVGMYGLLSSTSVSAEPSCIYANEIDGVEQNPGFASCWYAGLGYGATHVAPEGSSNGFSTNDDVSSGYKVFVGQHFKPKWFWELAYADLGKAGLGNINPTLEALVPDAAIEYQVPSLMIGYLLRQPDKRFNVFGKAGVSAITNKATDDRIGYNQQTSVQLALGVGAQYRISDRFHVRMDYDSYDTDANYLGLTLAMKFGNRRANNPIIVEEASEVRLIVKESGSTQSSLAPSSMPVTPTVECAQVGPFFSQIRYASGSAKLTSESKIALQQVAKKLIADDVGRIQIQAHTDSQGEAKANMKLSQRRSDVVMDFLISQGVPAHRLESSGFGEIIPIADNSSVTGRAKNRRIEFAQMDDSCR